MTPEETASALPDGDEAATSAPSLLAFPDWLEQNQATIKEPLAKYRGYSDYVKQETLAQGRYSDTFVDKLDTKLAGLAVESGDYPLAEGQTEYVPADVLARPKSDDIPIDSLLRKAYSSDTPEDDPLRGAVSKYEALRRLRDEGRSTPEEFAAAEADLRQLATPEVMNAATRKDVKDGFSLAMVVPPATEGGAPDVFVNKSLLEFVNPKDRSIDTAALGKALKMKGTDPSLIPAILSKLTTPAGYGKTAMEMEMHGDDMSTLDTLARTADADRNYKLYEELGKIANSRELGNNYAAKFGEFRLKQLTKGTPLEGKDLMTLADDFNRMREMPEIDEANPAAALRTLSTGEVVAPMNLMLNDTAFATALKSVPLAQQPYIQKQREYAVESSASDIIRTISDNPQGGDEFVAYMDSQRAAGKKDSQIVKDWVGMGKFSATSTTLEGVVSSLGEAVMPYVALATGVDPDGFAMKAMQGAQIEDANRRAYADLFGKPLGMGYDLSRLAAPIAADLGAAYLTRGASMAATAGVRATAGVAVKSLMRSALTAETRSLTGAWVRASAMSGIKSAGLKVTGRETVDEVVSMAGRDIVNKIATGTAYTTSMATGFNRSALSTYASLSTALSNQTNPDGTAKYSPEEVKEIAMTHSLAAGTITAAVVGGFSAFGAPGLEAVLKRGGVSNSQFTRIIGRLRKDVGKLPQGIDTSSANAMLTDIVRKAVTPIWKNAGLTGGLQEGAEEGIESFLQTFNESMATGERVDILAAAKQAFYESVLGGVAGGTITGVGAAITDRKAPSARVEADIRRERLLDMAGKLEATSPQTAQVFRNYAFQQRALVPQRQQLEGDLKAAKTPEAKLAIQTKIDTLNEQSTRSRTQELAPTQENIPEADATAAGNVPQGGDEGMAPEGAPVAEGSPEAGSGRRTLGGFTGTPVASRMRATATRETVETEFAELVEQEPAQTAPTAPEVSEVPLTETGDATPDVTVGGRLTEEEGNLIRDSNLIATRDLGVPNYLPTVEAIRLAKKLVGTEGLRARAAEMKLGSGEWDLETAAREILDLGADNDNLLPLAQTAPSDTLPNLQMPPRKRSLSGMRDATVDKLDALDRRLAAESDEDNYGVLEAGKQRLTELLGKIENVMLAEANAARQELTARPLSASPEAIVEVAEAENVTMAEVVKTPDTDANYLAAVETGDIETAQRLVDEAAKTLGLTEVFHGTRADTPILPEDFRTQGGAKLGAGAYFTPDKFTADGYDARNNASRYFIDADLPGYAEYDAGLTTEQIAQGVTVPLEGYGRNAAWAVNSGGVEIVVRDNRYIYSAEPVIRDAKGKPIPLSERFKRRGNAGQLTPAVTTAPTPAPLSPRAMQTLLSAKRIGNFSGPSNADARAAIMSEIAGKKIPKAKAGVNAFVDAVADHFGVTKAGKTLNAYETDVTAAIRKAAEPDTGESFGIEGDTPMLRQYKAIKRTLPKGSLLAYRVGDFYEFFGDDARTTAPLMDVALTKRNGVPMSGVPYFSAKNYFKKLTDAGNTVAVSDQPSDVKPGQRKVTEILSPETTPTPTETSVISDILTEVPEGYPVTREQAQVLAAVTVHPGGVANALAASPEAREAAAALLASKGVAAYKESDSDFDGSTTEEKIALAPPGTLRFRMDFIANPQAAVIGGSMTTVGGYGSVTLDDGSKVTGLYAVKESPQSKDLLIEYKPPHHSSTTPAWRVGRVPVGAVELTPELSGEIQRNLADARGWAVFSYGYSKIPFNAEAVDTYGIKLPEGYVKQGDLYVFNPASPEPLNAIDLAVIGEGELKADPTIAALAGRPAAKDVKTEVVSWAEAQLASLRGAEPEKPETLEFTNSAGTTYRIVKTRKNLETFIKKAKAMQTGTPKYVKPRGKNFPQVDIVKTDKQYFGRTDKRAVPDKDLRKDDSIITGLQDPEYRAKLVKRLGESEIAALEDVILAKYETTREELLGETRAQPATAQNSVQSELDKFGISDGITAFLTNVAKRGGKQYGSLAQLLLDAGAGSVDTRLVNLPNTDAAGFYVGANGVVHINTARNGPRGAVDTVLHELLHAVTEGSLKNPTPEQAKVIAKISRVRATVIKRAKAQGVYTSDLEYALGSNSEFLTHFFTSQRFRDQVSSMTPKSEKNWVQVIADLIADLVHGRLRTKAERMSDSLRKDLVTLIQSPTKGLNSGDMIRNLPLNDVQFLPSNRQALRVRLTREALTQLALDQESWKDWYSQHQETLDEFFGDHAEMFQDILAATSQAATVKANVGLALKAFGQIIRGEPIEGFLPAVRSNLGRLRDKLQLEGQKISAYQKANAGDIEQVVVDRHISRMLFGVDSPSKAQFEKGVKVLSDIARKIGWKPSQVQAALWAASIVKSGKTPQSYADYLRKLEGDGVVQQRIGIPAGAGTGSDGGVGRRGRYSPGVQPDGGIRFQPATARDVARFNQLTESLYNGRYEATAAEIDTWREANPDAWAELSRMRETVLREMGYDVETFRGQEDSQTTLGSYVDDPDTLTVFSTTSRKAAELYNNNVKRFFVKNPRPFTENANFRPKGEVFNVEDIKYYVENGNHTGAVIYDVIDIPDDIEESMSTREAADAGYAGDLHILFNPEQIKSADPLTSGQKITPDQWADAGSSDIRFQPAARASDAAYLAAVEAGDMDTAQRMVDDAARAAGYGVKAYHGGANVTEFNVFPMFLSPYENVARSYAENRAVGGMKAKLHSVFIKAENPADGDQVINAAKIQGVGGMIGEDSPPHEFLSPGMVGKEEAERVALQLQEDGFDSAHTDGDFSMDFDFVEYDSWTIFNPSQIKSADPVTYDAEGNVIPLSQRFNATSPDIRFKPLGESDFAPASLRDTATGFLPDDVTLDDLAIDFADLADIVEGLDPVNAENVVHAKVNHALARRAGEAAIPAPVRDGFDSDEAFDAATVKHAAEVARLTDTYELITRGRLTSEAMFRYRTNPGALTRLVDYLTAAVKAAYARFTARYDVGTAVALNRMSRDLARARKGFNHDIEPMAVYDPDEVLLLPVENTDTARFNELTKDLDPQDIEGWKASHPEELKELTAMRERVLRAAGYDTLTYHGTPESGFTEFRPRDGQQGIFFSDKQSVADSYTMKRGMWLSQGKNPKVVSALLRFRNPLVIDALGNRWDNIPFPGVQWKPKSFGNIPSGAINVNEAVRRAFEMGHDAVIIRDVLDSVDQQSRVKSTVYAVRNPTQIKSADPLALNASGRIITPDQWGDTGNPSIQFQPAVNEQGFYSQLERVVEAKIPNRATPEQIMGTISNPSSGVKAEEIKWSGIEQALGNLAVDGKVSKDALLRYLAEDGAVRFEEVRMGAPTGSRDDIEGMSREELGRWYESQVGYNPLEDEPSTTTEELRQMVREYHGVAPTSQIDAPVVSTRFGQYVLPGGENYREVVLAMPPKSPASTRINSEGGGYDVLDAEGRVIGTYTGRSPEDAMRKARENGPTASRETYTSSHFPDVPNYVAHMRTNERDGGLFIEELQSDRHQAGRKKGYKESVTPDTLAIRVQKGRKRDFFEIYDTSTGDIVEAYLDTQEIAEASLTEWQSKKSRTRNVEGIADAPFRTTWPLALFKRALRDAVASGKDWIGWTTGETQGDRFDLSKQIDQLNYSGDAETGWGLQLVKDGEVISETDVSDDKLDDNVGKDVATRIRSGVGNIGMGTVGTLEGLDLKVGGSGMKGFYDNMLPKEIGKYVKQWGGKVEKSEISNGKSLYSSFREFAEDSEFKPFDELSPAEIENAQRNWNERKDLGDKTTPIWRIDITPAMRESVQQQGQVLFQPAAPQSTARQEQQLLNAEAPMQRVATLFKRDPGTKAGADITPSENAVIRRLTEFFVNPFGALSRSNTKSKQNRDAMMETIEYTVSSLSKRLDAARTKEEANPTAVQLAVGNIDPLLTPAMQEQIKEDFVNEVSDAEQEIEATYEEEAATNPIEAAENRAVALAEAHKIAERNRQKAIWSARSAEADSRREQQLQALAQLEREAPDTYEAIIDLRGTVNRLQRLVKEANPDSPEIHAIVDQSFGVYLVRSYGIHQDPKQIDLMMNSQEPLYKERREALTAFFKEKAFDEIMSELDKDPQFFKQYGQSFDYDKAFADMQRIAEAESGERAKMMFEDYMLSRQSARGTFGEGSTVTNEIQRYMAKSNMPQEFLDALMVNEDPVFNIANTAMSLGRLVFNSRMLNEIYDSGIESGRLITDAEFKTGITYADGKEEMRRVFATGENDEVKLEILDVLVKHLNAKAQEAYDNGRSDTPPDKDALYVQAATAMQDFVSTPNSQLSDILPQLGRRADRTATDTFISSVNLSRESKAKLQARPGRFAGWQPLVTTNVGNSAFKPLGGLYAEPEQVKAFNATFRINSNGIGHFADDFVAKAHRFVIAGAGASLLVATQGSPAYFVRNVVGNTFVGLMNGVTPFRPENLTLASRTFRSLINERGEPTAEMQELIAGRIVMDAAQIGYIKQLIEDYTGNPDATVEELVGESARADIKAGKLVKGSKKAAKAFMTKLSKLSEATEVLATVMIYADFKRILTEADFGTEIEIIQEASRLTKRVTPGRSETASGVTALTRSGFGALFAPFLRFKVDTARVMVNSLKLAHEMSNSDNPVLKKHGRIKMASWYSTVGLLTIAMPLIFQRAFGGFGEDEDEAIRASLPDYYRNASLFYFRNSENNGLTIINSTFTNPLSFVGDPISRITNAALFGNASDIPGILGRFVTKDFIGENIVASNALDVMRNKDSSTNYPIYFEADSDGDKVLKSAIHLGKAYAPRLFIQGDRFVDALRREGDEEFWYSPLGVALATVAPFRPMSKTFDDMERAAFNNIRKENSELWRVTSPIFSPAPLAAGEATERYNERITIMEKQARKALELYDGFTKIRGGDETEVKRSAVNAGMSKRRATLLFNRGLMEKQVFPDDDLRRVREIDPARYDEIKAAMRERPSLSPIER